MPRLVLLLTLWLCIHQVCSQDPLRFREEVADIVARAKIPSGRDAIVFTGSSSIRLWTDLADRFSDQTIVNTGFGGSSMADLLHWAHELIIPYNPSKVFVYEGDNDLAGGTSSASILTDASKLVTLIHDSISQETKIYFLTPKPSIVRWHLKEKYEAHIRDLRAWASAQQNVTVIDVWSPLLDETGKPNQKLFLDDNLHINKTGYDLWLKVIEPYVNGDQ